MFVFPYNDIERAEDGNTAVIDFFIIINFCYYITCLIKTNDEMVT